MRTLLLALCALSASSIFAGVDPATYQITNGIKCENIWLKSRYVDAIEFEKLPITSDKSRTACIDNGIVYVASSANNDPSIVNASGKPDDCATIYTFDMLTGEALDTLLVTADNKRVQGPLCANQIGTDDFGNLWISGKVSQVDPYFKVYSVDKTSGNAILQVNSPLDSYYGTDCCDIVGDITRQKAKATIMAASNASLRVYRWTAEQGSTKVESWKGGWNEGADYFNISTVFPSDVTDWGTAPTISIVTGKDKAAYDADLFYIDGGNTPPALYSSNDLMLSAFMEAPTLVPETRINGVDEIQIGDRNLLIYSIGYSASSSGKINVCEISSNRAFTDMKHLWTLPEAGLGQTSAPSNRIHSVSHYYVKDAKGREGAYILDYKCMNGIGVYFVGDEKFDRVSTHINDAVSSNIAKITINGDMANISEQASEIAIYNIGGQKITEVKNSSSIALPSASGIYIIKAIINNTPLVQKVIR